MKIYIYIVFFFVTISDAFSAQEVKQNFDYTSVHDVNTFWKIPFFAPSYGTKFFTEFSRAFEIISVTCDGKKIEPTTWTSISGPSNETFTIKTSQFVYFIAYNRIESIAYVNGKIEKYNKMNEYRIPKDVKKLVIKYIVHYPDQTTSLPCSVTSLNMEYISFEK